MKRIAIGEDDYQGKQSAKQSGGQDGQAAWFGLKVGQRFNRIYTRDEGQFQIGGR